MAPLYAYVLLVMHILFISCPRLDSWYSSTVPGTYYITVRLLQKKKKKEAGAGRGALQLLLLL